MSVTVTTAPIGATIKVVVKTNATIPSDTLFKVSAKAGYDIATSLDPNIDSVHQSNLPNLDPDVSDSATDLEYYILRDVDSGDTVVLATVWIESISVMNTSNYSLELTNINTDEYEGLVKILNNYGLANRFKLVNKS